MNFSSLAPLHSKTNLNLTRFILLWYITFFIWKMQIIMIESTNIRTSVVSFGKLTLVDLAGSERAGKTGATGDTLKEAISINQGLSALGELIGALTSGAKHLPYRNHVLTELMSDSLGGTAKTLMFVNISPADYNSNETKNSLQFAQRCRTVTNNVVATKSGGGSTDQKQVQQLRLELDRLKSSNAPKAAPSLHTLASPMHIKGGAGFEDDEDHALDAPTLDNPEGVEEEVHTAESVEDVDMIIEQALREDEEKEEREKAGAVKEEKDKTSKVATKPPVAPSKKPSPSKK
jgi:hypothetical protein